MRHSFVEYVARSCAAAALAIACVALSGNAAFARVDPALAGGVAAALSEDAGARVTGGGTVIARAASPAAIASFGVTARRPVGFVGGGAAEGRINYELHAGTVDRHVNVPIVFMQASVPPTTHAGGQALLLGDCATATCPIGISSVVLYVKDGADQVPDDFAIYFCSGPPSPPSDLVPGGPIPGCDPPEGGALRSGNIQIRAEDR